MRDPDATRQVTFDDYIERQEFIKKVRAFNGRCPKCFGRGAIDFQMCHGFGGRELLARCHVCKGKGMFPEYMTE